MWFFFFQAEDGMRDYDVTGVQTCALPIYVGAEAGALDVDDRAGAGNRDGLFDRRQFHQHVDLRVAANADNQTFLDDRLEAFQT